MSERDDPLASNQVERRAAALPGAASAEAGSLRERHGIRLLDPAAVRAHLQERPRPGGSLYWVVVIGLALATGAAIIALAGLASVGPLPRSKWAYSAATFAFLLSTAHAAPVLAFATRRAKGAWGISVRRPAELFVLAGLVTAPLGMVLLSKLPGGQGRASIWFDWPGSPWLWDGLALSLFGVTGMLLLAVGSVPDMAAGRDGAHHALLEGQRAGIGPLPDSRRSAGWTRGWRGTVRQWRVLPSAVSVLSATYFALYLFVHFVMVSDLAISLVPGWSSAVIPIHHAVSGLQGGVAATLVMIAALRRFGGLHPYIDRETFHETGKLLLVLSVFFFYFVWSDLLTLWYGDLPHERWVLTVFNFGPYAGVFIASLLLNFALPFLLLLFNRVRNSIAGTTIAATLVLIGNLVERVRLFVPAWSIADVVSASNTTGGEQMVLPSVPAPLMPASADLAVLAGLPAAVLLLLLLALRVVPAVSRWEHLRGAMLTVERPYLATRIVAIAKPS